MMSLTESIRRRGGLAATFELYGDGHTRAGLSAAAASGLIIRVRQGWYSTPDIHPLFLEAARVGGRLTCLSALDVQGYWSYPTPDLHVAVARNSCRLRSRRSKTTRLVELQHPQTTVHWRDGGDDGSRFTLSPIASVADLIVCQPDEVIAAVAGSVLHKSPGLAGQWSQLVLHAPASIRGLLASIDGVCESGTESLFLFRISPLGIPIRRQVVIASVGRVDFQIGERLIVEVDGAEYHTDPVKFEADRRRDAVLSRLGYRVLRFSYRQVMFAWAEVEAAVFAAVLRGDHH
ncbi:very-short-patch-repair endonuclease [Conyzicola nivalis]|uniref:Very-short-patch-repair endonuclease n=1 Tax=Conyzicola nivalis TaxID=1477021 RepID=A0ABV2QPC7_9MICO